MDGEGARSADQTSATDRSARLHRLLETAPARRLKSLGEEHRHVLAGTFFVGGFVWDLLTLRRIDAWFDNLLLSVYLIALTGLIYAAARAEFSQVPGESVDESLERRRSRLRDGMQFLMGALFSAFVVFYGQSASLGRTSVYLALLVVLLVANEFVHRRMFNLTLLLSLYFLAAASFLIFFLPVVLGHMQYASFLAASGLSAMLAVGLAATLKKQSLLPGRRALPRAIGAIVGLAAMLNIFYLTNLIPPVPLAMKYGGVYHNAYRTGDAYELWYESAPWYRFWSTSSDPFHYVEGEAVYCFAAVFAPTDFTEKVFHTWEYRDRTTGEWVQTDHLGYNVVGGRDRGYRGFTVKQKVKGGDWRVLVEDARGFVLGKISFTVVPVDVPPRTMKVKRYY